VRVVLDSSVLVAAYISRAGPCAALLEDILNDHEWVASAFIVDELSRKLKEKFGYPDTQTTEIRATTVAAAELVTPEEIPADVCRDPNDLPVLGTAVAGRAGMIVTIDKDLLALKAYRQIPIVKPGEFWKLLDTASAREVTPQADMSDNRGGPTKAAK
jgi:uncharacterized protein